MTTIAQQASSFREGLEEVVGEGRLSILTADELGELWCGNEVSDADIDFWQGAAEVAPEVAAQAGWLWEWLKRCEPAYRSEVLQFATGDARLPVGRDGWRFKIDRQHNEIRITPSADNGLLRPALLATVHTCDYMLHLPAWQSAEELAEGMAASVKYGGGFGTH